MLVAVIVRIRVIRIRVIRIGVIRIRVIRIAYVPVFYIPCIDVGRADFLIGISFYNDYILAYYIYFFVYIV